LKDRQITDGVWGLASGGGQVDIGPECVELEFEEGVEGHIIMAFEAIERERKIRRDREQASKQVGKGYTQ